MVAMKFAVQQTLGGRAKVQAILDKQRVVVNNSSGMEIGLSLICLVPRSRRP